MKTPKLKKILLVLALALVPFALVWVSLFLLLKKFIRAGVLGLTARAAPADVSRWRGEAEDGPLAEFLAGKPGIRRLSLRGSDALDSHIALLAGLKNLAELDLSHTVITDAGLEHILALDGLRSLALNGAVCLAGGFPRRLGRMKGLCEIYLYGTRATPDDVEGFKRMCRGCAVVAWDGENAKPSASDARALKGKIASAAMNLLQSNPSVKNPKKAARDFKWTTPPPGGLSAGYPSAGYLTIWLRGGQTVFWLGGGEVVRRIEMDSKIEVLRHSEGSLYGINGFGLFEYSSDLEPAFSSASFTGRLLSQRRPHGIAPRRDVVKTPRGTYFFLSRAKVGPFDYDDEIIEADVRGGILWAWSANENLAGAGHLPCGGLQGMDILDDGSMVVCGAEVVRVEYPSGRAAWRRTLEFKPLSVSALPGGGALVSGEDFLDGKARIAVLDGAGIEIYGRRFDFDALGAFSAQKILPGGGWLITNGASGEVVEYTEDFVEVMRVRLEKFRGQCVEAVGGLPKGPAIGAAKVESVPRA